MTNPTILPTFFAKEPLFAVFFYTIAKIFCPVPCPTEVWCPIHHCAYRGMMPQHRDGCGMRCPMTRPTVRQKTQRAAWAYAVRCDGECNALHGHMHRTAFSGAELRGLAAADRGSESQALPMPEERLPLRHHLRRPRWTKAVPGQKNRSAPPRLPHWPRKTRMVRRWSKHLQWPLLPHLPRKTGMVPRWDKHPARPHLLA